MIIAGQKYGNLWLIKMQFSDSPDVSTSQTTGLSSTSKLTSADFLILPPVISFISLSIIVSKRRKNR